MAATFDDLDMFFDDILFQFSKGVTYEMYEKGIRYEQFEQVKEWQSKFGFKFNIYSNDHLIDGKKHFHFDHKEQGIACKMDFQGNVLECKGKTIPPKVLKDLQFFVRREHIQKLIHAEWDNKNPELTTGI